MSTAVEPRSEGSASNARQAGVYAPPAQRGHLNIADKVVEKIASQCAYEIAGVGGRDGGFLGVGRQADLDARPKVSVELTGQIATLSVELGVEYPRPIEETTQYVRETLARRVSELAGVNVRQVDIRVTYLVPHTSGQEGRELL